MARGVMISTFCMTCGQLVELQETTKALMPESVQPLVSLSNARKHCMLENPLDALVICAKIFFRRT
jgi:hypothetical protein